ncbi:exonuclease domain-containing protein [Candidatus Chloroploca asiatica]|uniref:DNA polymerase III subunit epsilon n=1 Tax=Candidatus Chloroploca asiatica TaxID=1506545 RepID=A0A2H3L2H3_9CHLR|nr:exonuclease domain-containing protein [Candidatus Chloroploca asiatica]PDV97347.1 DNA polymerase III subunit epsilon [Candidatus Chloroploca asiatica]
MVFLRNWDLFRKRERPAVLQAYEAGPWPDPRSHWRDASYVVLDVETSGLDPRRDVLLAIGLVGIEGGRIRLDTCWRTLVRPPEGFLVDASSIRIHNLTRAEVAEAPTFDAVLPSLIDHLARRILVVHVSQVDVGFLNRALRTNYGGRLAGPIIDTARLAMRLHDRAQILGEIAHEQPAPAIQLRALATSMGLPVFGEHDALNDALTTAQLFLAQAARLDPKGNLSIKSLLRSGGV